MPPKPQPLRARLLLRDAVNTLIADKRTTHRKLVEAGAISNGVLGRLRHADDNTGVDTIDGIANAVGVEPWQLLHPDPRFIGLSEPALEAAAFVNRLPTEGHQRRAVELLRQVVEFQNLPALVAARAATGVGPVLAEDSSPPIPPTRGPARTR